MSQDPIYVTFPVSQRELLEVRKQAEANGTDARAVRVKVQLADRPFYDQVGTINFVDVTVSATTDTVAIRAQLPNPKRPSSMANWSRPCSRQPSRRVRS